MVEIERREHERILIEMPTRMWLDEMYKGKHIVFEGHARTRDLAIGGTFLESTYLLPVGFPLNLEVDIGKGELLSARGEIVHALHDENKRASGMGLMFVEVDAENRERLLRFFISSRIRDFYDKRFIVEFPHLESVLSLQDVALVINLWEDREGRLTKLHRPGSSEEHQRQRVEQVTASKRVGGRGDKTKS